MKTEWDYTLLADAYLKRPDYSDAAIDAMLKVVNVVEGASVCDVGAGVAHLTIKLAARGLKVNAVEPNNAMRQNGKLRTGSFSDINWFEGTGENTGQEPGQFDLVTFGSSFNVCDRDVALKETIRILNPQGWFACMWNHRNLEDPIQKQIEETIRKHIPDYGYGARREDQTSLINGSGLFEPVVRISADIIHSQTIEDCVSAWRSHATLERQAGDKFNAIVADIETFLKTLKAKAVKIPYATHIWVAQRLQG
jgi:ubiquinone/menaquinone biosynthesis C-methylase UbiE